MTESPEGWDELEPCVLTREERGDRAHWMRASELIKVAHRANVLRSDIDHYELGNYNELAGPVAMGVLDRLEDVEFEWCPDCFEVETDDE